MVGRENWRKVRQTRFWARELGGVPQNDLNLEAPSSGNDLFTPSLTKTVLKHVLYVGIMDIQYITTLNLHLRQQRILGTPTLISFGELRSSQFYLRFHYDST